MKFVVIFVACMLLVQPAFAFGLDDVINIVITIIDFILHPTYLINMILQFFGIQENPKEALLNARDAGDDIPEEYEEAREEFYQSFESFEDEAMEFEVPEEVEETVYIGFVESGLRYGDWTVVLEDGEVQVFEQGGSNEEYGEPSIYVTMDKYAVEELGELTEDADMETLNTAKMLYLDGHINIYPADKATEYIDMAFG